MLTGSSVNGRADVRKRLAAHSVHACCKFQVNGTTSEVLRTANISVTDQEKCRKVYARNRLVTSNMICAGDDKGEKDTCQVRFQCLFSICRQFHDGYSKSSD